MAAVNSQALSKFKGILEVRPFGDTGAFTRLASVRGLIGNLDTTNVVDVKADDTGSVYKVTDVQASMTAEFLENADRDTLDLLFTGTKADVAGVLTPVPGEALGTGWTVGQPIKLANKNGDNTIVTAIVIDADAVALTPVTDYSSYVGDGTNGDLGYTYIVPVTAQAGVLDADYSYTPNASESITIDVDTTSVKNFEVKITASENSDDRVLTLSNAAFESTYGLSFADVFEQGDITGSTVTFNANKGSTITFNNAIL